MDVLIVGAGICGLSAAIGLRRQGHRVTIFERSRLAQESGAAIFLPPNANGPLRAWGFLAENYGGTPYRGTKRFTSNGKLDRTESFTGDEFTNRWDLIRRSELHAGLKELAVGPVGDGAPVRLLTSSRVVSVDTAKPSLTLENGNVHTGHVILGADGAHSVTRAAIDARDRNGKIIEPFSSGRNCFRFLIDRNILESDPVTREVYTDNGYLVAWYGEQCHLVTYPCQHDKIINFVAIHPRKTEQADDNDYNTQGSYADLRAAFVNFEPVVQKILDLVDPIRIKLYPLMDMHFLPTYTKGKLALLGDAAHPFLPYLGQGGAQAVEDAVSIAVLLPLNTGCNEIERRLKLYEQARKDRVERILSLTRAVGLGLGPDLGLDFNAIRVQNFEHDESKHSAELLREDIAEQQAPKSTN